MHQVWGKATGFAFLVTSHLLLLLLLVGGLTSHSMFQTWHSLINYTTRWNSQEQTLELGVVDESFIKGSVPGDTGKGKGKTATGNYLRASNGVISGRVSSFSQVPQGSSRYKWSLREFRLSLSSRQRICCLIILHSQP